jgi:hypothetical protein
MAAPKPTLKTAPVAPAAEVTPEVTVAEPRNLIGVSRPLFETTTEGAPPPVAAPVHVRKLNAKTLAEHAAGKEAISQYAPAE